ncbi:LuxR family transcriptional regulator [Candidatus Magnetominusculus xianensis]|uniref:LuxR family transcriptional regulator n=2 Tax=Candidatus Magnetominusculus xianensis TaxID=1748249 RepID=A0ABR5SCR3_9BACT|nr:LuxR family transcriptional regulator [Candidatus Magnetominusculus xianensis]
MSGEVHVRFCEGLGVQFPGLLTDTKNQRVFSNAEGLDIAPEFGIMQEEHGQFKELPLLIKSIYQLCDRVKNGLVEEISDKDELDKEGHNNNEDIVSCTLVEDNSGHLLSLRAFSVSQVPDGGAPLLIMVLIERIARKHSVDLKKAGMAFNLSKRESEVLELVCFGSSNKEIADKLFISKHTV